MLKEAQSRWGIPRCPVGGTRSSDPVPSYLYARQIYLSANSQTVGGDIPPLSANFCSLISCFYFSAKTFHTIALNAAPIKGPAMKIHNWFSASPP